MKKRYRIIEFRYPVDTTGQKFFVETGTKIREKLWLIIYRSKTIWEKDVDDLSLPLDQQKIVGWKTFDEAVTRLTELKNREPIIHEVI